MTEEESYDWLMHPPQGGTFHCMSVPDEEAVEFITILEKSDSTTNKRKQCTHDFGSLHLPIKPGSDHSDLLYDEYQVRMATPRRQWNAYYPGEIRMSTWNISEQCKDNLGFHNGRTHLGGVDLICYTMCTRSELPSRSQCLALGVSHSTMC